MAKYSKIKKVSARIMADKSISQSFKGILRIAHILDGDTKDDENKLSQLFYRNFRAANTRKLVSIDGKTAEDNTIGYPKAYPYGLDEANPITRYKSEDAFINAKLPVCDSMGNYLNINIGINGIVFGSDESLAEGTTEKIIWDSEEQEKYFPVLTSKCFAVGLKARKIAAEKSLSRENSSIKLMGSNLIEPKVIADNGISEGGIHTRTIYETKNNYNTTEGTENRGLIYSQENWDRTSYGADKTIDCKTSMVDLVEYVRSRVNKYIGSNTIPVPSGSVIWEYVSLWNYYAKSDDGVIDEFAGHRPKMADNTGNSTSAISGDREYAFQNTLLTQGLTIKTNKVLGRNKADNRSSFTEIVPIYKRDYVLCDGKEYKITPAKGVVSTGVVPTFDRLINLFLAIGYHYTDITKNKFVVCGKDNNELYRYKISYTTKSEGYKLEYQNIENIKSITNYDGTGRLEQKPVNDIINNTNFAGRNIQDLLWSNDLTSLITYQIISTSSEIPFSKGVDAVRQYLKDNAKDIKIDGKYSYYTIPVEDNSHTITYKSELEKDKEITFNIGKEITSFDSEIFIPVYDKNNNLILDKIHLYEHPAVNAFIDVIYNGGKNAISRWLQAAALFKFNVPNFNMHYSHAITNEDNVIISSTKYTNTGNNGIGGFIGSNAYSWLSSVYEPAKQIDYICSAKEGSVPHRHHVFRGISYTASTDGEDKRIYEYKGYAFHAGPSNVADCVGNTRPSYYRCDFTTPLGATRTYEIYNAYSYFINMYPVKKVDSGNLSQKFFNTQLIDDGDGDIMHIKETEAGEKNYNSIYFENGLEPNRCITSTPQWIPGNDPDELTYNLNYKEQDGGFIDFFSPECVYMVPLIKL